MGKVLGKHFYAEEDIVPGGRNREESQDGESPQSRHLDPNPCEDELPSSSVPGQKKRKRIEDGESVQREKSRRLDLILDPIPREDELPSSSVPGQKKRKRIEDGESVQREKNRRLDPISCEDELPSTSEDTESRNPPEAAQSERSADDGPVLDSSAMFKAKYRQQKKLGEGGCGCVYAGYRREDNLPVAIKHITIDENLLLHEDTDGLHIPMEVAVLRKLEAESERHSAHVDLLDWYIVDEELILVLERPMPAVDLSNYIESKGGHLKEKEVKVIIKQLVSVAIDLQEKHIFHRDIKPENLLIETCMKAPRVRVIDFGLSCFAEEDDAFDTFYGTHIPPEWSSREEYKAGPSTVYQIGMVLFFMRHKAASTPEMTFQELNETSWLSKDGKDFFEASLCADPDIRFTLYQLKHHPWLR
ncbi:serine/threonine-protein kinase pim-2-like [Cyclopterus lumpus]|uniref:serine/threonine-protein kinase pim-2-like n=2 Tax=Cyclopterus lumpus TaxID=8103 RepID=UPI0014863BD6|nr:serine/threonine-protein kinase pim-2-like [Cyclopterus lumpus]